MAAAHTALSDCGVQMSYTKVRRMVQNYERRAQRYGFDFGRYLDTQVASEMQRRVVADELRKVTAYLDPTGERAVNRVLRGGRP
jgi:isopentenyl diphosphate isomerase/L-lactate dehydrogenase-like FMN-dependent dehydrogenase